MDADLRIVRADLEDPEHGRAILEQLDDFARDPVGGGRPLPDGVRARMIEALRKQGTAEIFLAFAADRAVGAAICFRGFSTFYARPVLNVHDLTVRAERRGRGLGRALLVAAEERARELGCAKLTLEVHEDNERALRLYRSFGFGGHQAGGQRHVSLFLEKHLELVS